MQWKRKGYLSSITALGLGLSTVMVPLPASASTRNASSSASSSKVLTFWEWRAQDTPGIAAVGKLFQEETDIKSEFRTPPMTLRIYKAPGGGKYWDLARHRCAQLWDRAWRQHRHLCEVGAFGKPHEGLYAQLTGGTCSFYSSNGIDFAGSHQEYGDRG